MGTKGIHDEHRKRVRAEFLKNGFPEGTPEHKILEMLLFYSIPRIDTNELAHMLINRFGSISAVLDASPAELMKVKGVGENTASLLKLIMPVARCYMTDKKFTDDVRITYDSICEYISKKHCGYTDEVVAVTSLNSKYRIIGFDIIGNGDVSEASVSVRKVAEVLLARNATAAILSHNHPDGNALPSNADIQTTIRLRTALAGINIELIDHIIAVPDDYVSLVLSDKYNSIFK